MIFLTKLDGKEILLNELFIETVTETPDTVITMSNGHTYIVRESMKELQNKFSNTTGGADASADSPQQRAASL